MTRTPSTMQPKGFADAYEVLPTRFSHVFEIPALLAVLAGDAVAFQQVVAVAMDQSSTPFTWTLILALSAAATLSMHLAGVSARRREAGAHQPGRLWAYFALLTWLMLGGTALWVRLAHAHAQQAAASSGGVFGTVDTSAATAVPMAALMLGLYLVGGLTAYGIGYGMHNPARSAYLRARREQRRAARAHRRAIWLHSRAIARHGLSPGVVAQPIHAALAHDPQLSTPTIDLVNNDDLSAEFDTFDELAARREEAIARARAQADQLREVVRHRLATALAEPARTTGVFEGHRQSTDETRVEQLSGGQL